MSWSDAATALPMLLIVAIVLIARWNLRRMPRWRPERKAIQLQSAGGDLIVPVSQVALRGRFGRSHNGIKPKLWITPAGLRFRIFKQSERSFRDFRRVDARATLFQGTRLIFIGDGERLQVLVGDPDVARAVLRRLPAELPLSPSAAALRGDRRA